MSAQTALESGVQIPGGQTGPEVRTIGVTTQIAGVDTVVQMEVVALADAFGNTLSTAGWQTDVLAELRQHSMLLRHLVGICQAGLHPRSDTTEPLIDTTFFGDHI